MIDRIIHFSDLHIRMFKDHDLYRDVLSEAFIQWRDLSPDRIVFTGDLVHNKNQMTPELFKMIEWVLSNCTKIAKTVIIPGNHDFLNNNIERLDALSPVIELMKDDRLEYYKDMGIYEDENVSWCVYSQYQGNVPPDINEAKGYKIGLFHGPIQGLSTDLGYSFGEEAYNVMKFSGLDVVLCGDIHKRSEFSIPNGKKGYMIGSTIQVDSGESVGRHGYGLYSISEDSYRYFDLHNKRPFLQFKITSINDIEQGKEILTNG